MKGLWLSFAIATVAILFSILLPQNAFGKNKHWRIFGQVMMITPILVSFIVFYNTETAAKIAGLLANVVFIAAALGLMIHGVKSGTTSHIDTGLAAFVILVFTRFIDVFGSLLRSGFAFILIGLIMAAAAWGLYRSRRTLLRLSEENKPS